MLSTFGKPSRPAVAATATRRRLRAPPRGPLRISRIPSVEPDGPLGSAAAAAAAVGARRMPDPAMLDGLRESCVDGEIGEANANKKQVPERSGARRPAALDLRQLDPRPRSTSGGAVAATHQTNNRTISGCVPPSAGNCRTMDSNGNSDDFRCDHLTPPVPVSAAGAARENRRILRVSLPPLVTIEFPPPPAVPPPPDMGDAAPPRKLPPPPPPVDCGCSDGDCDEEEEDDAEYYETASEARGGGDGADGSCQSVPCGGPDGGGHGVTAAGAAHLCRAPLDASDGRVDLCDTPRRCYPPLAPSGGSDAASAASAASPLSPSTAVAPYASRSPTSTVDSTPTDARALTDDCSQPSVDLMSVDSGTGSAEPGVQKPAATTAAATAVVVAIDFGTAFSGYAYSFVANPNRVHVMRKWDGGDPGVPNQKIPTCLLLKPGGEFHSFGYGARDFFNNLDDQDAKRWCFFDKFKMVLHGKSELTEQTVLIASNGVKMPAHTIFAHALGFFKDHALNELADQCGASVPISDIKWVITVPAIWKQPAKQFMRQAAYEAGLADSNDPNRLLISLEPEAASIYCRHQKFKQLVPDSPQPPPRLSIRRILDIPVIDGPCVGDTLRHGSRYMVVDCGGGTVDITVHEIDYEAGQLNELHRASGGPYGSAGVDARFEVLLKDIFSVDFIETFKRKRPAGFIDLMVCFEARKRSTSPFKDTPLNIALPFSFIDYYKKQSGHSVESAIRRFDDPEICWSPQGMLRLTQVAMRRLFLPILDSIKQAIGDVLNHPEVKGIEHLFLVGGFAESPLLQHEIRKAFSSILKVIIPQDASLSIVKGAVMYGIDPTVVKVRRCPLTYGIGVLHRYIAGKHPLSKVIERNGQEWCTDVFDKLVTVNQAVAPGEIVLRSYTPANSEQLSIVINLYCTEKQNVEFVTDPGVKKCATLRLDVGSDGTTTLQRMRRREIQARVAFGDTEIKVTALDVASGMSTGAAVDFFMK